MLSFLKRIFSVKNLISCLAIAFIGLNLFYLWANLMVKLRLKDTKILEPGTQFVMFKEKLAGLREIGYLTNKDMSEEHNDGEFLQAQYMLAPVILRLNQPARTLNILDYKNPVFAVFQMENLNAKPLVTSPYGKVLVESRR